VSGSRFVHERTLVLRTRLDDPKGQVLRTLPEDSMHRTVPIALAALAFLACASTRLTSTWRDPAVEGLQFRKVAGIALANDPTLRRIAEDEFVRQVGPAQAVAGYSLISDDELGDRERVKSRLAAAGVDGAVIYRLVAVDERQRWVPPTTYGTMWGYWSYAPLVFEPGYLTTDRIIQVESVAYRVSDARLVWAARSETLNPKDAESLIDDVVRISVDELRREKLIP
jgi:hypothetical protein